MYNHTLIINYLFSDNLLKTRLNCQYIFTPTPESSHLLPGDEWLSGSECRHPKDRRSSKEAPAFWPRSVTKSLSHFNWDRSFILIRE